MCGINAIISLTGQGEFSSAVQAMNDCLAHRGPDSDGVYAQPGIALGHRRLSIIDLSEAGRQPMYSADGRYVIVYNGELYNYREVAEHFPGLRTHSDTEVLLEAWAKWGSACLDRFNGMFAFALYDQQEKELHLVRDRMGIKPVYYAQVNEVICFASELRAVLKGSGIPREVDETSLVDYLRYQTVHAPNTIIRGVKMLMPGHRMIISAKGVQTVQWWQPVIRPDRTVTYEEAKQKCRALLKAAVKRRLVADVPFGAFLSGGIDSSAVVALMSETAAEPVRTFCVTFDESEFSEAKYARQIAEQYNTIHHEIKLTPADFLQSLPDALDAIDHPSGDGINTYVVSKATRQAGIKMALSGLGGDELFAGYDVFRRVKETEQKAWLNKVPHGLRKMGAFVVRASGNSTSRDKAAEVLALKKIDFTSFYPVTRRVLSEQQTGTLLKNPPAARNEVARIVQEIADQFPGDQYSFSRLSVAEMKTYMQNVLLRDTDQMSMASALEVRVPFLDYELVEYVLSLEDQLKYPHTPKKLLVDALRDLLPVEITDRRKMGFVFPWEHWMKHELRTFCNAQIEWLCTHVKQFRPEGLRSLWNAFLEGDQRVSWSRVWPLIVLSYWMQKNEIRG